MWFPKLDEQKSIQEDTFESLKGMEHLIWTFSQHPSYLNIELTDVIVSKFKKYISLLDLNNHT